MDDSYRTIEKPAEGLFRDRNSRFLAFGFPVNTPEEASDLLTGIRKRYHDAKHHCFAYILGHHKEIFRFSDDGEPSGTAGKPIYNQLLAHDLTNVFVVVVRYFGGTLLGTGGLLHAYKTATVAMLENSTVVTRYVEERMRINFTYEQMNAVMKMVKDEDLTPVNPVFEEQCHMELAVRKSRTAAIKNRLGLIRDISIESL